MNYTTRDGQIGKITPMTWGDFKSSVTEEQRHGLTGDPLNRTDQEVAIDFLKTGQTVDQLEGYRLTSDPSNLYQDPTPRWLYGI